MDKIAIAPGVQVLNINQAGLSILCGSPPDVVKHLMKRGLIHSRNVANTFWETGPNAILLSEVPIQGGIFANMVEFPILQMFYRQGMIIPGHPNNTGKKPLILGLSSQLTALSEYLFRGTYGLANEKEITEAGVPQSLAKEIIRFKMAFAFNKVRKSEDILDMVNLDSGSVQLDCGVSITRQSLNIYTFQLGEKFETIDLNLPDQAIYEAPVKLGYFRMHREYFSIIHIGEGDGWDYNRPCMSSIVCFQGKLYLIDTGPNIMESLTAAGISVNEIEGIFHTHAHDDHFAGLTSLVRSDHRIKYYATPLVQASVRKKLSAIMGLPEKRFARSFEVYDLRMNDWNRIGGMEVMPLLSLHPVETTCLFFRAMWENGHRTYAHLADIAAFDLMEKMLLKDPDRTEVSEKLYAFMKRQLTKTVQLKKIDIGGGMIHGNAGDFADDMSQRIVLSHTSKELDLREREIGASASFGMEDVLIRGSKDYVLDQAATFLSNYFPDAKQHDIDMLLNAPVIAMSAGSIIQKRGSIAKHVHLVINGVADLVLSEQKRLIMLSAGTLIGEVDVLSGNPVELTYRTRSHANILQVPAELYLEFISNIYELEEVRRIRYTTFFLQTTCLFGEMVSSPIHDAIARKMESYVLAKGESLPENNQPLLVIIKKGRIALDIEGTVIEEIAELDFYGEDSVFLGGAGQIRGVALEECELFLVPGKVLQAIPIVEWKMLERYERRLASYGHTLH